MRTGGTHTFDVAPGGRARGCSPEGSKIALARGYAMARHQLALIDFYFVCFNCAVLRIRDVIIKCSGPFGINEVTDLILLKGRSCQPPDQHVYQIKSDTGQYKWRNLGELIRRISVTLQLCFMCLIIIANAVKQEAHRPHLAQLSKIAIAYLQMIRNTLPVLP